MPHKNPRKLKGKSRPGIRSRGRVSSPNRRASRIPGVDVGEVVDTSLGPKKKVCFNIGGRWYFRMVDPDWKAPGRPTKRRKAKGPKTKAS